MPVMAREARVTHLVQQHATLGPRTEPALNENVPPLWFVEPVAPVRAGQMMSAPHRAWRDAAVKQLGVQLIEQQLDSGSSPMKRHLPGGTSRPPDSNTLFCVGLPPFAQSFIRSSIS